MSGNKELGAHLPSADRVLLASLAEPQGSPPSVTPALRGAIDERKAISRLLMTLAARAAYRHAATPCWRVLRRMRARWSAAAMVGAAEMVERGEQLHEQAHWLVDISGDDRISAYAASVERGEHR